MDKDTFKGWMIKADHDLEVTRHSEILPSDVVCYHAQQAAEKYLKAFLIANDIEIKNIQIHDIDRLLVECTLINPEFEKLSNMGIGKLTDYAVGIRYPNDYDLYDNFNMPAAEETNNAISLAQTTVSFVREKLNIKTPEITNENDNEDMLSRYQSAFKEKSLDAAIGEMRKDGMDSSRITFHALKLFPDMKRSEIEDALKRMDKDRGMEK